MLDRQTLEKITGPITPGSKQDANAKSFLAGLDKAGFDCGLNRYHRLAMYIGQVAHESQVFRHDREIWGPTPAQSRYDIREDLGNTPQRDGDGFKYRGRTGIQITGADNYRQFTAWARQIDHTAPDFLADPDAVNADPWEGMGPIWYWSTRGLNALADEGDVHRVTRKINGGYNGIDDRIRWTVRASLVFLGYNRNDVKGYQAAAGLIQDGIAGPRTLAALHEDLVLMDAIKKPVSPPQRGGKAGLGAAAAVAAGGFAAYWDQIKAVFVEKACSFDLVVSLFSSCGG